MRTFFMIIGPPGSGYEMFTRRVTDDGKKIMEYDSPRPSRYSLRQIRLQMFAKGAKIPKAYKKFSEAIDKEATQTLVRALSLYPEKDIAYGSCTSTPKQRKKLLAMLKEREPDLRCICVCLQAHESYCLSHAQEPDPPFTPGLVQKMVQCFDPPEVDEGWDEVQSVTVAENGAFIL